MFDRVINLYFISRKVHNCLKSIYKTFQQDHFQNYYSQKFDFCTFQFTSQFKNFQFLVALLNIPVSLVTSFDIILLNLLIFQTNFKFFNTFHQHLNLKFILFFIVFHL